MKRPERDPSPAKGGPRAIPCAGCGDAITPEVPHFPFCSLRCRAQDLHGWLSGAHALPSPWDDEDEELLPEE